MLTKMLKCISQFIVILLVLHTISANAQSAADLRINEVLVENQTNYIDDFGQHSPWIEFYNSAYNTVNMGGLFLTNDLENPKKYLIPKGSSITKIPPRSYLVFWGDDKTEYGIRHLNFDLRQSEMIALFDADGKTLIDKIYLTQKNRVDTSYGCVVDGSNRRDFLKKTTPGANNNTDPIVTSADSFGKMDPMGIGMAFIAMSVVFCALAVLYIFFKRSGKVFMGEGIIVKRKLAIGGEIRQEEVREEITGEVNAAIAMALHLYRNQLHDHENTVLRIKKVSRSYSPWSSKIYGVMNNLK